jgi:hypothetical protein
MLVKLVSQSLPGQNVFDHLPEFSSSVYQISSEILTVGATVRGPFLSKLLERALHEQERGLSGTACQFLSICTSLGTIPPTPERSLSSKFPLISIDELISIEDLDDLICPPLILPIFHPLNIVGDIFAKLSVRSCFEW